MEKVRCPDDLPAPSAGERGPHDEAERAEEEILLRVLFNSDGSYLLAAFDAPTCPDLPAAVFQGGRRECLAFVAGQLAREVSVDRMPSQASEPGAPAIAA